MPYLVSHAFKIHYQVHGKGLPVVLLHGFSSSFARNWLRTGWVDFLIAKGYQVIGLDLRGHGNSDKPLDSRSYTTDLMGRDVLKLIDHLDIKPVNLLGFSMGGGIALHLAMNYPTYVRSVVACGVGDPAIRGHHNQGRLAELSLALTTDNPKVEVTSFGQRFRELVDVPGNNLRALAALMGGPSWPGYLEVRQAISVPVLVIRAERDEFMPKAEHLMKIILQAKLTCLPDTDHLTLIHDPHCMDEVARFFDEGL